jgi:transposase-like protein
MNKTNKFSPEVRERAVRLVQEHRGEYPSLWAAVESIAPKIGCVPQTLLDWVKREEVDGGQRDGLTTSERDRLKQLERENKELRRANEILKTASAFFAQRLVRWIELIGCSRLNAQISCGCRTSRMSQLGRAGCMWRLSLMFMPDVSWAGA